MKSRGQWSVVSDQKGYSVRHGLAAVLLSSAFWAAGLSAAEPSAESKTNASSRSTVIVAVGAGGASQFETLFQEWSDRWIAAANKAGHETIVIGRAKEEAAQTDREQLQTALQAAANEKTAELWIVLFGHGTFDRREAKFNLRGPDISAKELTEWLKPVERPTALVNCASASAPFLSVLASPKRVVIAATKSGAEQNFARFGDFFSQAIADPAADLDKDDQTSLWEAYLSASRRTAEFYSTDGRLLTEHALLDDNGDGQGVRADQFRGLIPIEAAADGKPLDGQRAHQWHLIRNSTDAALPPAVLAKRNQLELAILQLRDRKPKLPRDEYLQQLERLLVELAELNESAGKSDAVQN